MFKRAGGGIPDILKQCGSLRGKGQWRGRKKCLQGKKSVFLKFRGRRRESNRGKLNAYIMIQTVEEERGSGIQGGDGERLPYDEREDFGKHPAVITEYQDDQVYEKRPKFSRMITIGVPVGSEGGKKRPREESCRIEGHKQRTLKLKP